MTDYILVGGGPLAREILEFFSASLLENGHRIVGYLVTDEHRDESALLIGPQYEVPCLGPIRSHTPKPDQLLIMAIGGPAKKAEMGQLLIDRGAQFATLIHPKAYVSSSARLGVGVVIEMFAIVSVGAVVGDFVLLNNLAGVGHDVVLGEASTLSSYVDLTGGVKVGAMSFFGTGARVLPKVIIGKGCTIGAGAVVVRSIPDGATVYAAPASRL